VKNQELSQPFEGNLEAENCVSSINHTDSLKVFTSQPNPRKFDDGLGDVPLQLEPVRADKPTIDGDAVAAVNLENADGLGDAGQPQSGDKLPEKNASQRVGNKVKLVALLAALILVAGAVIFVSSNRSPVDEAAPQMKPVAPTAKSPRDIAKIEDQLTTVSLSGEWRKFNIAADPDRPLIALWAKRPFRIRVNGELYLVAASSSPEINFGTASFIELRAVDGNTDVKITRSALLGMNNG